MSSSYNVFYYTVFTVNPEEPQKIAISFGDLEASLLHAFWALRNRPNFPYRQSLYIFEPMIKFGLLTLEDDGVFLRLNDCGQKFLLRLTHEISKKTNKNSLE
jgi:hypothetical protein